jgi:hypothetical protein
LINAHRRNVLDSPGRKAGDRTANVAIPQSIPGLPAWAIKEFATIIMSQEASQSLDIDQLHRHFSSACFNETWRLIDNPNRTARDNEAMILSASTSLWHWMQRPDCSDQNLSIGHWQLSRVYALVAREKTPCSMPNAASLWPRRVRHSMLDTPTRL